MLRFILPSVCVLLVAVPRPAAARDIWRNRVAPAGQIVTGIGIAAVWTMDLVSRKNVDMTGGFFKARDRGTKQLIWPHVIAEYATATGLVAGAAGLYREKEWGRTVSLISSGALAYTSINSMSWVLSERGRMAYAAPMMFGLMTAGVSIGVLF
ncbi:MAG TPA: hypothetical protein PK251_11720 [Candidatus Latescibacteria bacterium]|nr:hypothetical protein [Candidatus Latescibacterota bacterium]HOS65410.1 hypothetical protein [Candidatus Latescibacterota bacterium]HPK75500.1 hypothetical protein [Candidatus Latescibacterota bacterium]